MKLKKTLSILSAVALAVTALCTSYSLAKDSVVTAADTFTDMDQNSIVADMGAGWNVGNQLEAASNGIPNETAWGNPVITKDLIKAVKDAGFKTVRVPVSYLGYIGDKASGYKIDESWLARVKEVVDYAYDLDMYVIVNMHGDGYNTVDGGWLLCNAPESEQPAIKEKYKACWQQIADKFKDYDEHLIFESMNEEFDGDNYEGTPNRTYYSNINAYNQIFVDTVRQTGSNNAKRWLLIPGWNTNIDLTVGNYGFALPTDKYRDSSITKNRIMVSVHYYAPWDFCGDGTDQKYSQWGKEADPNKKPSYSPESYMEGQMQKVYNKFVKQGYPVIIGEYGCINKSSADPENTKFRAYYDNTLCNYAKQNGCVPVYWDNGAVADSFGLFNRKTCKVVMPEIVESIVSVFYSAKENLQRTVDMVSVLSKDDYSSDTWTALESALTKAQNLLKNSGTTDSEYTSAYNELYGAYRALEKSENYSEELVVVSENTEIDSSKDIDASDLYIKSIDPALTELSKVSEVTIKFTVDGDVSDNDKVFILKPYDNENWSGWDDNFITIGDCTYDNATGEYTVVVDAQGVLASYSGSREAGANAINLYYAAKDPNTQLTYCSVTVTEGHVHDYSQTERVDPTKDEDGYVKYSCSGCNSVYKRVLPATGEQTPTVPPTEEPTEEPTVMLGDLSGDGKITTADVGIVNAFAKGVKEYTDEQFKLADVNGDGKITTADVGIINAHAKGVKEIA